MAGRRSLELLCLGEEDVLPHLGVILAQSKALGRGFRVFARDIEEARAGAAHQLDEDGLELSLRHLFCSQSHRRAPDLRYAQVAFVSRT